jgi:methionyl-tRNA formyltransferase
MKVVLFTQGLNDVVRALHEGQRHDLLWVFESCPRGSKGEFELFKGIGGGNRVKVDKKLKSYCGSNRIGYTLYSTRAAHSAAARIQEIKPDLIVLCGVSQIIGREIYESSQYGAINVHPSLLPKYRGATPLLWSVLNNDRTMGVSIHRVDDRVDGGAIYSQREFPMPTEAKNFSELLAHVMEHAARETLGVLDNFFSISPIEQDETQVSWAPRIKKADQHGAIDWYSWSSFRIFEVLCKVPPWFTPLRGSVLKIRFNWMPMRFSNCSVAGKEPGNIYFDGQFFVSCRDGKIYLRADRGVCRFLLRLFRADGVEDQKPFEEGGTFDNGTS